MNESDPVIKQAPFNFAGLLATLRSCRQGSVVAGAKLGRITAMRHIGPPLISLALYGCSTNHIQPYPDGWPSLPKMSNDCGEVVGVYEDGTPSSPGAAPPSAWAFLLPHERLRLRDRSVTSRTLSLLFDSDRSLHVVYAIDDQNVATKAFLSSDYKCEIDGLHVTLSERSGAIYDKVPNFGFMKITATIRRDQGHLYIKNVWDSKGLIFYVVPSWGTSEYWARFLARNP